MVRQVAPDDFGKAIPPDRFGESDYFWHMNCETEKTICKIKVLNLIS